VELFFDMALNSFTVVIAGPLFLKSRWDQGVYAALNDIGLEGVKLVHEQLYKGHGFRTGHLKRSVSFLVNKAENEVVIDSGASRFGKDVVYAEWVETGKRNGRQTRFKGYHMFENAAKRLTENDKTGIISAVRIGDKVGGAGGF